MSCDLLKLIQEKCSYIHAVRSGVFGIEVKLPDPNDERAWISYHQAPQPVEELINSWLKTGGKI